MHRWYIERGTARLGEGIDRQGAAIPLKLQDMRPAAKAVKGERANRIDVAKHIKRGHKLTVDKDADFIGLVVAARGKRHAVPGEWEPQTGVST